jgi:Family of unknown function (DUF6088)
MLTSTSATYSLRQRITAMPLGEPFTPAAFSGCGTRAAVDQALSRLVKAGVIERVARGVLVRPETSRFVKNVMPEPLKVAQSIANATGAVVQLHGAEAARQLGLTTQVATQPVFLTSGPSRRIRVGSIEIQLQHVCMRKLALAGQPAGLALAAMWYLGKTEVTSAVIEKIRQRLSESDFLALKAATHAMPAWMSSAIIKHGRTHQRVAG